MNRRQPVQQDITKSDFYQYTTFFRSSIDKNEKKEILGKNLDKDISQCYIIYRGAIYSTMIYKEAVDMERFVKIYQQGLIDVVEIWVDTATGVNYVFHRNGNAAGFTPLLDQDGKPVVTP